MPNVNFYLKPPVVYACEKHQQNISWLPGMCTTKGCKESRTIRKNPGNKTLPLPSGERPACLVYLQMRYHGQKLVYSMRFNVEPKNWDAKKQMVKSKSMTTEDGSVNLNELLKNIREECIHAYNKEMASGVPTPDTLRKYLNDYMFRNLKKTGVSADGQTLYKLIDKFINGDIGDKKAPNTIATYRTSKKHLEEFEKEKKYPINFDSINLEFRYAYVKFLANDRFVLESKGKGKGFKKIKIKGLSPNSVAKEIKAIRVFMNMANKLEYTKNNAHKSRDFSVDKETTDGVYLRDEEIEQLYKFDFSGTPRLETVRDFFVFNCHVGLRYEDATKVTAENIVTDAKGKTYIKMRTGKNKTDVAIFCDDTVLSIFKKYKHNHNRLPPAISGQKYNKYLKELCEIAGLMEVGRFAKDLTAPLFKKISAHTARRSYITNLKRKGIDDHMIKSATGHSDNSKAFAIYNKETPAEAAERMGDLLSKKSLKAV